MATLPTGAGPVFRPQLGPIVGLDFSQSGRYLATLGEENMLRMWKLGLPDSRGDGGLLSNSQVAFDPAPQAPGSMTE